MHNLK